MKKKILIFDDERDILEIIEIALQNEYQVFTESSLDDPIQKVSTIHPDIVLMDVWIPPFGGEQAVRMLKSNEKTKDIIIIFFSASNDIAEIAEKAGADGYFIKPFRVRQLKDFLKEKIN